MNKCAIVSQSWQYAKTVHKNERSWTWSLQLICSSNKTFSAWKLKATMTGCWEVTDQSHGWVSHNRAVALDVFAASTLDGWRSLKLKTTTTHQRLHNSHSYGTSICQAAPFDAEADASCGCNRCCCCCWPVLPMLPAPAASSRHASSAASAVLGSGRLPKSGAIPNLSMSTPRGVRYLPTVMIRPELSLSSYTDWIKPCTHIRRERKAGVCV